MYQRYIKRIIDVVFSALGLVILSPLFLIIALAIEIEDPGPVLFKQRRVGVHKSYFNIAKFRSMRVDTPRDVPTHMLADPEHWVTKVGGVLRKTSLDELPQLALILTGKMSIIGPRPALWNQEDLVAERDKYSANDVRPGLTGLAQVSGRDTIGIVEKARLDGEYVKSLSFKTDARIFFMTIFYVLKHQDVVEGGTGAMEKEREE